MQIRWNDRECCIHKNMKAVRRYAFFYFCGNVFNAKNSNVHNNHKNPTITPFFDRGLVFSAGDVLSRLVALKLEVLMCDQLMLSEFC